MLIRIALIIAIVGGLVAGGLNIIKVKEKIVTTLAERDQWHNTANTETAAHRKFEKLAKETQAALDRTNALLVTTIEERDTAQNELAAWHAVGVPLTTIKATLASLRTVTEERDAISMEKKILGRKYDSLKKEYDFLTGAITEVPLPAGLKGKVLATDPRYDFVVLNIGEKQGLVPNGRMLVNRNGKLIAKVQIKSVQADRSIANVMPGWKLGEIMEGDQVLY